MGKYAPLIGLAMVVLGIQNISAQTTLRSLATERGAYIGSILNSEWFNGSTPANYETIHKAQFNIVVPENEMKFDALEGTQNVFNYTKADKLVTYAKANGMRIRGHALAWHSQVPSWVTSKTRTRDELLAILKNHITNVVTHFKGKVDEWDVVNEAITDGSPRVWRGTGSDNSSVWGKTIGADFIDSAFVWAHAADPDAKLYYNDYAIEWGVAAGSKAKFLLDAIVKWKANGIPIHAVGTQTHIANTHTGTPANVRTLAKELAKLNIELAITELDIGFPLNTTPTASELQGQGHLYAQFMDVVLEEPNMNTCMIWGFTDAYSWLPNPNNGQNKDFGLIYDKSYNKKPAYDSLIASLQRHAALSSGALASSSGTVVLSSSSGTTVSSSGVAIAQTPYSGAIAIPGRLQVENYDLGGQDVAYNDLDPENQGDSYRQDGVDLGGDANATGYVLAWTGAGEWLEYTVNVASAGNYSYSANVASNAATGVFHVEIDGINVTGPIAVPSTGGYNTYSTVTGTTTVALTAGSHVLRIAVDASPFNLDWIEFTGGGTTSIPLQPNSVYRGNVNCTVYGMIGNVVKRFQFDGASIQSAWSIQRAGLPVGKYLVKMEAPGMTTRVIPMINK